MDWLHSCVSQVKTYVINNIPKEWEKLRVIVNRLDFNYYPLEIILPIACCKALDEEPSKGIVASAALFSAMLSLRIADDIYDNDNPNSIVLEFGQARAWNFSSAFKDLFYELVLKSNLSEDIKQQLIHLGANTFLKIAYGQEQDLLNKCHTIEDFFELTWNKTSVGYAAAAQMGAIISGTTEFHSNNCHSFGYHLGNIIQIFNEFDAIWGNQVSDLSRNKLSLPLIYGLNFPHEDRQKLRNIVANREISKYEKEIKQILENIDTKKFLHWSALKERKLALQFLKKMPNQEGAKALEYYLTSMFGDLKYSSLK